MKMVKLICQYCGREFESKDSIPDCCSQECYEYFDSEEGGI